MKILHVNGYLSGGGVEQYLAGLFPGLKELSIENVLLYGEKEENSTPFEGVRDYYIEGITRISGKDEKKNLSLVRKMIADETPHLVYFHQTTNAALVELVTSLLPTVKFVHDFKIVCPDGRKTLQKNSVVCPFPLGYRCQLNAYRHRCMPRNPFLGIPLIANCIKISSLHKTSSHIVVASHFMKDVLISNAFSRERVHVLPYFTALPSGDTNLQQGLEPSILALGRITKEKGFGYLLRAFSKLNRRARLSVVGDGPELKNLRRLSEDLGIASDVTFEGWLSHDGLDEFYRRCTLVVVPSLWPEPFGIVGIEAMAYRKPVVAFDVGGISEWIEDGRTGYLVPRGDIRALTEKITFLMDNPKIAQEMGETGRTSVDTRFTVSSHCESLVRLFQSVRHSRP